MGSLMAGWDSPIIDEKTVAYKRNLSLTKGEIEAYWKAKKKAEEEHLGFITSPSDSIQDNTFGETLKKFERSNSAPLANTKEVFIHQETETGLEKLIKKNGWWTRSNWAFLNEPPTSEGASNTYTSQFHVASLDTLKSNASEETS
ncbi:DNA polymerase epsilon catalytic [Fagus crenata]